jgi:hypothetical protein
MWVFTKIGFFSAVEDRNNRDGVLVRARFYEDAQNLKTMAAEKGFETEVIRSDLADYAFRLRLSKAVWARIVGDLAKDIDYENFKNSVHGDSVRDSAYMRCWSAMYSAQNALLHQEI